MAGRYDSNPFEEEDVNPFSVRANPTHPPVHARLLLHDLDIARAQI
jgi:hypothetical protein